LAVFGRRSFSTTLLVFVANFGSQQFREKSDLF
jgi:hypothetical protein